MCSPSDSEQPADSGQRVLAYCHDSVGIGHLRRTMTICERVGRTHLKSSFLLGTGTPYVPFFQPISRVDWIKLPALAKQDNGTYRSKYLAVSLDRLMRCRERMLLQAAKDYDPDVFLVDKAPLGVCRELVPTLTWLREHRPGIRIIFGMRDIEDDSQATIAQWARDGVGSFLESCFDEVWVYGMRELFDVADEYALSPRVRERLRFMGYVARKPCDHPAPPKSAAPQVLVTVGGGTDGARVLETYLGQAARRVARMGGRSVLVGGPDLPAEVGERLRRTAATIPQTHWTDFEPCMSCRIRQADLVVTMGGYNTLCDLVSQRKPALVVPRIRPRMEQAIRARLWEQRGAVRVFPPEQLAPEALAGRVAELLRDGPRRTTPDLDLNGLERVAERFDEFWAEEKPRAASVFV